MNQDILLGVLTYQVPHRKTYDVCCRLKATGYRNVKIFALPMHYIKKKQPLIQHRPTAENVVATETLAQNLSYQYICVDSVQSIKEPSDTVFLICGAGILPQDFVGSYRIINAHPGYIPHVRGLDALKWAVYEKQPIGVTTHLLGEEVDAGIILQRKLVPIRENDTFHTVAQRQYELETAMLVDAISLLGDKHEVVEGGNYPIHKRMPLEKESILFEKFQDYRKCLNMKGQGVQQ